MCAMTVDVSLAPRISFAVLSVSTGSAFNATQITMPLGASIVTVTRFVCGAKKVEAGAMGHQSRQQSREIDGPLAMDGHQSVSLADHVPVFCIG